MARYIAYETVVAGNCGMLDMEVEQLLGEGLEPIGGVSVGPGVFAQAMGKPAPTEVTAITDSVVPILRNGDTVILNCSKLLSHAQKQALSDTLHWFLPDIKFLLIDGQDLKVAAVAQFNKPE